MFNHCEQSWLSSHFDAQNDDSTASLVHSRISRDFRQKHKVVTLICTSCGESWEHEMDCGDRTCVHCNEKRRDRIFMRYSKVILKMAQPKFLTLTVQRSLLCKENIQRLRAAFDKLRSRKFWKAKGGLYQIELGTIRSEAMRYSETEYHTADTCNMHIHAIIDGPYMLQCKLAAEWKIVTQGWGYITYISRCDTPQQALVYMTKHMTKVVGNAEHADLINFELHNTRLVQGFGYFFKLDLKLGENVCPFCGAMSHIVMVCEEQDCLGHTYLKIY